MSDTRLIHESEYYYFCQYDAHEPEYYDMSVGEVYDIRSWSMLFEPWDIEYEHDRQLDLFAVSDRKVLRNRDNFLFIQ